MSKSQLLKERAKKFHYILFSKSGFTENLIDTANSKNVILFDMDFDLKKYQKS